MSELTVVNQAGIQWTGTLAAIPNEYRKLPVYLDQQEARAAIRQGESIVTSSSVGAALAEKRYLYLIHHALTRVVIIKETAKYYYLSSYYTRMHKEDTKRYALTWEEVEKGWRKILKRKEKELTEDLAKTRAKLDLMEEGGTYDEFVKNGLAS